MECDACTGAGVLRATASGVTSTRNRVLGGRIILTAQVAVSLVLLMAAGLLLRTLRNYATQNLGMQAEGLLVFGVTPQGQVETHAFYRTLLDRLRQEPGVVSVSMAGNRPGSGWSNNDNLVLDGIEQKGGNLRWNGVGADFFHTMNVPILAGRDIGEQDVEKSMRVVVVNETLAARYLAHTNPSGTRSGRESGNDHRCRCRQQVQSRE